MKILLIEDDKDLIETLKELLEQEGYFIDYFTCLDEMDDYIILNKYDLNRKWWHEFFRSKETMICNLPLK